MSIKEAFQSDEFYKIYLKKLKTQEDFKIILFDFGILSEIIKKAEDFHSNFRNSNYNNNELVQPFFLIVKFDYNLLKERSGEL